MAGKLGRVDVGSGRLVAPSRLGAFVRSDVETLSALKRGSRQTVWSFPMIRRFTDIEDARAFAQAIVDTVREPVLVLDKELRVIAASRSFYSAFKVRPRTPKAGLCTRWAMVNGTSRSFGCSWKKSCPRRA